MVRFVDLHMHSIYSDGSFTPEGLVDLCKNAGFSYMAITDHDVLGSYKRAVKHSSSFDGPQVIPAFELSSNLEGEEIHILGYFVDFDNPLIKHLIETQKRRNIDRLKETVEKLNKLGFALKYEDIKPSVSGGTRMSPQIIKALTTKTSLGLKILTEQDALDFFRKYLTLGSPCFSYHKNHPFELIDTCNSAKVLTSLAHPHKIKKQHLVEEIIEMGIHGLEYYYPRVSPESSERILSLSKKFDLVLTGGSDFHGLFAKNRLGQGEVPETVVKKMLERKESL